MRLLEFMDHINLCPHKVVYYDKDEKQCEIATPNWGILYNFIEKNKEKSVIDWQISTNFEGQIVLILCF